VTFAAGGDPGPVRWASPVVWVGNFVFAPLLALTTLILLLFPDGRPPTRRWRPLIWLTVAVCPPASAAGALLPQAPPAPRTRSRSRARPRRWSPRSPTPASPSCSWPCWPRPGRCCCASGAPGAGRRQQLKWLAYGGAFLAAVILADLVSLDPPGLWDIALETLSFGALYLGVGMAVLRHRPYDIDRIINRTLVYGLVTALLAGVYAGLVFVLGGLLNRGGGSELAVAAATLAVAALFGPARRRVQQAVDRRFNRARYDAARTVERFSARLRDQVELDTVSAELLGVVDRTLQPTRASLWLRPPTPGRR
jgi:hypothetical protein